MSATLRYDLGIGAASVLAAYEGSRLDATGTYFCPRPGPINGIQPILADLMAMEASRWAGIYRAQRGQRNRTVTFAVKLPSQVALAYRLMHTAYWLATDLTHLPSGPLSLVVDDIATRSLLTLAGKLLLALGFDDMSVMLGIPDLFISDQEQAFFDAIATDPGDLATWHAYADWLSEQSDANQQQRGQVIAGWLAEKAMKVKCGVPVIANYEKWKRRGQEE